ncbi:MAG: dicarboxylate/amino acid:cation symporter [Acidobacteria bacterium]|nr:MAG: dicarboxylate/amino acid:cation symporter [Acidobacteria bacterium 13_1_40CM_2_68_10]OLE65865.1 MAG: dicarboxylate/amino acid:cation symporter [Acidobacteria bacterium 13_1_20CM_2_68_14]PYT37696.1 MAG: dicarboxylate/amino acid:cation symporter [Acidobacteriota bacterium]
MISGAVLGVAANLRFGGTAGLDSFIKNVSYPVGLIFLRLIFMVVIPLILSAIILGVAELGDARRLGRIGLRTLAFTLFLSSVSVFIGVTLANVIRPGAGMPEASRAELLEVMKKYAGSVKQPPPPKTGLQILLDLIPENPVEAMVNAFRGDMLAVMVFALVLGIALTTVDRRAVEPLLLWLQALYEVVLKVIALAMRLAPVGVAALLFSVTALSGLRVLKLLALYVLTVLLGLALHQFCTYSLLLKYVVRYSPQLFFRRLREVMLTAFSTSSSNATLPTTLRVAEQELGIPRSIAGFVLTLGSTLNQNGTALYEGITVLFLAQFFDIHLTVGGQITVVLLSILSGIGTAGVPGGSLPLVMALLVTVGIPPEGIGIIFGVDRLLDMCRTVLNVTGDVTVAACVTRSEGHILKP